MPNHAMFIGVAIAAFALAACSKDDEAARGATTATASPVATVGLPGAEPSEAAGVAGPAAVACTDFRSDLEDGDMVRIYYAAADLPPPREKWAERILNRMDRNLAPEEAWTRAMAEVDAHWNALKDLRCVTLRASAGIERYDSARGGLVVGAFSPNSYYDFSDYGDRVRLKILNAERAGLWKMAPARGQALTANNDLWGTNVVARLRILGARPSQDGGIVEAEVVSFDVIPRDNSRAAMETVQVEG
jgi:hypothetical protein